jgi:hypothetical protein
MDLPMPLLIWEKILLNERNDGMQAIENSGLEVRFVHIQLHNLELLTLSYYVYVYYDAWLKAYFGTTYLVHEFTCMHKKLRNTLMDKIHCACS